MFQRTFECKNEEQFEFVKNYGLLDDMRTFEVDKHIGEYEGPGTYCVSDYEDADVSNIEVYGFFDSETDYVNFREIVKI